MDKGLDKALIELDKTISDKPAEVKWFKIIETENKYI